MFTWGQQYEKLLSIHSDPSDAPFANNVPTLNDDDAFYAEAYLTLNNSRDTGFGIGPIKFSEIAAYLSVFPVPDVEAFVMLMQVMDGEFVGLQAEKNASKTKHNR